MSEKMETVRVPDAELESAIYGVEPSLSLQQMWTILGIIRSVRATFIAEPTAELSALDFARRNIDCDRLSTDEKAANLGAGQSVEFKESIRAQLHSRERAS